MPNPLFRYFSLYQGSQASEHRIFSPKIGAVKQYPGAVTIDLPLPDRSREPISNLLENRQSCRTFANTSMNLQALSFILYWSVSELARREQNPADEFKGRPHPSGGAKFPIELYVLTAQTCDTELKNKILHYRPDIHALESVAEITPEEFTKLTQTYQYEFVGDIPVLLIFSYIRERNVPKYGYFGEKLALIEAGHIAQNIMLLAQEANTSTIALGGGDGQLIDEMAGFDSYNESSFYTIGLGT